MSEDPKSIAYKFSAIGGVGIILTDTIYGLAARAVDKQAVSKLYELKHRENKPGTLIASNIEQLVKLGIKKRYLKAVSSFWPSKISIVIPTPSELEYLDQGKKNLAIRVVNDQRVIDILNLTGPLITSSANLPGREPAIDINEAIQYFGSKVNFYIDSGKVDPKPPSTIIQIIDDAVVVLRQGEDKIDI